ncbi:MAG: COX15/CtaA family protein [Planctomycetes bacterium]|nr:COX15/CtaA family protein [Planctomycetota bacterium]
MTTLAPPVNHASRSPRALSVAAILTACAILPLVFVGAGVTSTDSGMAYKDWPTSAGHLVNPPSWWQADDTRWEHGHRLLGWTVGMLAIVVAVLSWPSGGIVRTGGVCLLAAIIIQGVLGGMRVREVSTALAMVHGIWGQLCFCLACTIALVTSKKWHSTEDRRSFPAAGFLQRLCLFGVVGVFLQLILGAALRHFDSTPALVGHLLWAVFISLVVGWIAMWVVGQFASGHLLGLLGRVAAILLIIQLLLGGLAFVATRLMHGPSLLATLAPSAHVLIGALLLACMVSLTFVSYKGLSQPKTQNGPRLQNESVLA